MAKSIIDSIDDDIDCLFIQVRKERGGDWD